MTAVQRSVFLCTYCLHLFLQVQVDYMYAHVVGKQRIIIVACELHENKGTVWSLLQQSSCRIQNTLCLPTSSALYIWIMLIVANLHLTVVKTVSFCCLDLSVVVRGNRNFSCVSTWANSRSKVDVYRLFFFPLNVDEIATSLHPSIRPLSRR